MEHVVSWLCQSEEGSIVTTWSLNITASRVPVLKNISFTGDFAPPARLTLTVKVGDEAFPGSRSTWQATLSPGLVLIPNS